MFLYNLMQFLQNPSFKPFLVWCPLRTIRELRTRGNVGITFIDGEWSYHYKARHWRTKQVTKLNLKNFLVVLPSKLNRFHVTYGFCESLRVSFQALWHVSFTLITSLLKIFLHLKPQCTQCIAQVESLRWFMKCLKKGNLSQAGGLRLTHACSLKFTLTKWPLSLRAWKFCRIKNTY